MSKAVGIDLGTTNSVVAYTSTTGVTQVLTGAEGFRIVPSVIYFDQSDGTTIVGERALQFAVLEPARCARLFKRGMGEQTFLDNGSEFVVDGKVWRPEELSSLVLKKLKLMAEQSLGSRLRMRSLQYRLTLVSPNDLLPELPANLRALTSCESLVSPQQPQSLTDSNAQLAMQTFLYSILEGEHLM